MKVIKRILTIIITIILVTIFTYNIYNLINIKVLKKDISPVFGYTMLEVVSGSMEPTIHVGDMIIVDTLAKNYKENDIITFRDENGALVTHRIISLDGSKMITKGDNNDSPDPENTTDQIIGRYVTKLNGLGRIMAAFKSPMTMVLILIIGIITCVLVSTDKEGNPILEEDEKEFLDYLKNKEENKVIDKKDNKSTKEKATKKESTMKKETTKKASKAKSSKDKSKNATKKTTKKESTKENTTKTPKKKSTSKKQETTKKVEKKDTSKNKTTSTTKNKKSK